MYYPCSENKGADQLRGYREADLRLCFRLCRLLVFPCGGSFSVYMYLLSGPRPLGPKEIDGLLVHPGKAYTLLTDHLITGPEVIKLFSSSAQLSMKFQLLINA